METGTVFTALADSEELSAAELSLSLWELSELGSEELSEEEEAGSLLVSELEELEEDLKKNGWAEMFSQGNQEPYPRARPQGQSYNTMNANYLKIIQKLDGMLPKEQDGGEDSDGFDDFVSGRDAL